MLLKSTIQNNLIIVVIKFFRRQNSNDFMGNITATLLKRVIETPATAGHCLDMTTGVECNIKPKQTNKQKSILLVI